jgi:membrane-associated phospholipid phosphatase
VILSAAALVILCLLPLDARILQAVQVEDRDTVVHRFAHWLSEVGELDKGNLLLLVVWLGLAILARQRYWKRAVLAVTLAAITSGIFINFIRPTVGRPRPHATLADGSSVPDGAYGPTLDYDYHGFPSGHTTTAFATGVTITLLSPPAAVPALAYSVGMGWSRMQMDRHHLTDVIGGAAIGTCFAICFASGARRRREEDRARPERPEGSIG